MQEPNQNKTRVKIMKKQRTVTQCIKHMQKASSSAKLSCSSPSQERSDFNPFFPPPKNKRQILKWVISKGQFNKKKQHFFWFFLPSYFTQHCILSKPALVRLVRMSSLFQRALQKYHRRLCPSDKWCSTLKRIFLLKTRKKVKH